MDHIEATNISILDWDGNLTISATYSPPSHVIRKEQYNVFINWLGHRFLVGGDFNAKHKYYGSRLINPKGRELYQTIQENIMFLHIIHLPVFISKHRPVYIKEHVSKTVLCLCFEIKPTKLGLIDRASPYFRTPVPKSHCNWRPVSLSVLVSSSVWGSWPDIFSCLKVTVLFMWGILSDERMCPSFVRVIFSNIKSIVNMYNYLYFTCY
jgi:hypothetical protein